MMMLTVVVVVVIITIMIVILIPRDMHQELVISQNIGGQLQIHTDWPSSLRNKGVYFVKRDKVISKWSVCLSLS